MSNKAIVLDANILIRAVLGKQVRQLNVHNAGVVQFFAPDVAYADAQIPADRFGEERRSACACDGRVSGGLNVCESAACLRNSFVASAVGSLLSWLMKPDPPSVAASRPAFAVIYSRVMPAALTIAALALSSRRICSENSSGVLPTGR